MNLINFLYRLFEQREYIALQVLIFLAASLLFGGIVFLFSRRSQISERLNRLLAGKKAPEIKPGKLFEDESHGGLTAKIIHPIHKIIAPTNFTDQKSVRLRLVQAGLRSKLAYSNYLAAKVVLAVVFPLPYLLLSAYYNLTPLAITIAALLAIAGFFVPNLVLLHLIQKRQQGMSHALPDAVDLMVVCVEAGLGLDMTFKRVGDELHYLNHDLSDEFHLTNLEVMAGKSREESFKNMSARTGIAEVHNLMNILSQTSRLGTSMANALRVHADAMRVKRRQMAEEQAAKTGVKLIFPLILCIFPAIIIVLAGPAAIKIMKSIFPVFGGG
jgi:tight adherence protein C